MRQLVRLFTQITLLRRGPQDLPVSLLLLVVTIIAYIGVNLLMNALFPATALTGAAAKAGEVDANNWPAQMLVDTVFTIAWYVLLMRIAGRPERTLQTTTAVFGVQVVLAPLFFFSSWLYPRFAQDSVWGVPVSLLGVALFVWLLAANSHIVREALEWSAGASVALVILQIVASELLGRQLVAAVS